jgi:peptide/nickel transport system substrate-binding protein
MDPQLIESRFQRYIGDNIYEALLTRAPDGSLTADGLAADFPEQIDPETWQFTLRDGIQWHNGDPFTSADVVASVERIIDPDFASEQASYFGTITGAEAVDDLTVNVTTNGPDPALPTRMYMMRMIPAEGSQAADFGDNPVGTGPYKFVEWARGDHITIEKNPDYWGDNPSNVSTVTYVFVPEPSTRLSGLISGEYDITTNMSPEDAEAAPATTSTRSLEHAMVVVNETSGITADERVRDALNLAIDKQSIVDNLFQGHATVDPCQPIDSEAFGYHPGLEPYPYDPDQARQLIEEAGATGEPIELISVSGVWLKDREVSEAIVNFWNDIGLDAKLTILELSEHTGRLFHGGENIPDAIFVSTGNEMFDADRNLSAYLQPNFLGGANDDPRMTELLDAARTETDLAERQDLYEQTLDISCEDSYLVDLYNPENIWGTGENITWPARVDGKLLIPEITVNE